MNLMNLRDEADRLMDIIDAASAPPLSQEDALALLEELQGDIETRIDGLRSDLDLD